MVEIPEKMPFRLLVNHDLRVAKAGRFPMSEANRDVRYRDDTACIHLHDYQARLLLGKQEIALQAGDVTFTAPGVVSRYDVVGNGTHLCVHFHQRATHGDVITLPSHIPGGPHVTWVAERLRSVIELYRRSLGAGGETALVGAAAALQEVILRLALLPGDTGEQRPLAMRSEAALKKLVELIEAQLTTAFTLSALAANAGLEQDYLARLFRTRYGMSISRFILQRRIEIAQHLLLTSGKSIKEIAWEVGIPNPQYFNKQYRRIIGHSPSAGREGRN